MSTPILHCHQLSKTYRDGAQSVPVLNQVDFSLSRGETVAIIGASGAGKSTLLQLMGGLDTPTNGVVTVLNQNIHTITERKRCELRNKKLGFIYQFHHLLPEFSALENVCMPLLIARLDEKTVRQEAELMMEIVGLKNRMTHRIGELSGGERQRVAIARALVHRPACVLADEPTGNLDQHTADTVFELMLELNRAHQTSFVIVTHNEMLARRCDRVLTLSGGRLSVVGDQ